MTVFRNAHAPFRRPRRTERGYVLLSMLLVVAMMAITLTVALPTISFQIRRDREQEMIHRGVQYSRAIRAYYKKFGRYPTRLEDLDDTNKMRFLRKHYKDPVTGQDFKLLHYGEPGVTMAGGIGGLAGGSIPGANSIGSNGGGFNSSSGANGPGGFSQPSAFGSNSNSAFASNSNFNSATANNASGNNSASGSGNSSGQTGSNQTASNTDDSNSAKAGSAHSSDQSSGQLVSGGPIVGVASVSKKTTIREFNHKKKYNEWQFVYDPTADRGGLISTPSQPALQGFGSSVGGQGLQPGNNNSPFGQSSGFGQPSGFGNQGSGFGNGINQNQPPQQPPPGPSQQQQ